MSTDRVTITCDRLTAEALLAELSKDPSSQVYVDDSKRRLAGAIEVVMLIAQLTTIGRNLLDAWMLKNRSKAAHLDVQPTPADVPVSGGEDKP